MFKKTSSYIICYGLHFSQAYFNVILYIKYHESNNIFLIHRTIFVKNNMDNISD